VLIGGGGIPRVLNVLAEFAGNPVFLETADGELLYAAGPGGDRAADPLQVWEGLRGRPEARHTPPAGTVLVDVPGGGQGAGAVRARLVLPAVDAPPHPVHRMAAERAAGLLAVVLMQARQEEELAARGRGDFLTDLAEGLVSPDDAPAQARLLGFRHGTGPLLPVVMRLSPASGTWAPLAHTVLEELSAVGVPVLLGVRPVEGRVPVLVGLRAAADRDTVADRVATALRTGVERAGLDRAGARPPVVVVGRACDWNTLPASLRHAGETATAAQGLTDRPWYDARRLDIELLLWRLRDDPDLAAFVDRALGPLRDHDTTARPPLLPTLETYLSHTGRKAETARELHLNRQTLYNRLARISELLGTDLDDPQSVLTLSLALRARRHLLS
ncbi:PucR family transcriptional regulator, partial [Streptomyces sp. NPDC058953]